MEAGLMVSQSGRNLDIKITGIPPYWFLDGLASGWIIEEWKKENVIFICT